MSKIQKRGASSVTVLSSYRVPKRTVGGKLEKILFIPDVHAPYHDKKAWDILLQVAHDWKPDHVYLLGDFVDMYAVSSHSKDPRRARNLEFEVNEACRLLDTLKGVGKRRTFIMGNHENRLERYLCDKAPELFNVVKVDKLLGLKERGWDCVPYRSHVKLGKLYLTHDVGKSGATAHAKARDDFQGSVVMGHTHRMGVEYGGDAHGSTHVGAVFGHLLDLNEVDYMHKIGALRTWQTGFGTGYLDSSNGCVHLQPVPILKSSCVVEGKIYRGK